MTDFKIGDFVEVDIGYGLYAVGQIITEQAFRNDPRAGSQLLASSLARTTGRELFNPDCYKIKFLDGSTHTALHDECEKLSDKDSFVLKLKGGGDKELSKIYSEIDRRIQNGN